MPVKTTGAQFKRFYSDPAFWPDNNGGTWHDEVNLIVDGIHSSHIDDFDFATIPDHAHVTIDTGIVFGATTPRGIGLNPEGVSLETYFRRWLKLQSTTTVLVQAPRDKLPAIEAAIQAAGGRVLIAR